MRTALLLLLCTLPLLAGDVVLHDTPLPDVKASIRIPEGWTSKNETDDGVFVYQFGKPAAKEGAAELAAITLSVTTKVPERTEQTTAAYAASLVDMPQDDGSSAPVQKGELNGLPFLRSEYNFDGDTGKMRAVNIAIPNEKTGTLYFFAWQAPLNESLEIEALREKILSSAKFDPAF